MARPKLYKTEEERKAADKARLKRWLDKDGSKEKQYKANQKTQSERWRRWRLTHLKEHRAKGALEKARKLQRCPPWADLDAIKQFYLACPAGYHVDHIIPLCGKLVNGLHIRENLQYLPALDNLRKGNRFEDEQ
jgi:hypothetical protein